MPRLRRIGMRTYRHHRLEVLDDGGPGWAVAIHGEDAPEPVVLRNAVPNGLEVLLLEARGRVDRRLDGAEWQREPRSRGGPARRDRSERPGEPAGAPRQVGPVIQRIVRRVPARRRAAPPA